MAGQMKGLAQFIADIRNAKEQEEEDKRIQAELVNIQRQFADHQHLSGYQRKKYICKLLFIYLLGNSKFDYGFMESVELLSSNVYSEKQIGYLAIQFFIGTDKSLLLTIVNTLKNDLKSSNSDFVSLALQSIATVGEETLADSLAEDVFLILRSPAKEPLLKKKASLALLKLLESSPHLIFEKHPGWIPRIVACLDNEDLGFAQCVASVVEFIAKNSPELAKSCIPSATRRLSQLLIDGKCPPEYNYYEVPAPWFTIKLLNLIEILIPDSSSADIDNVSLVTLRRIVSAAIEKSVDKNNIHKNAQFKNAQSSILFSAISLGAHLDPSSEATIDAINALGDLIQSTETNTRYLSLDALVKVASRGGQTAIQATFGHLSKVLKSLKDKDISIRRKALDLLYTICDSSSVENICAELLQYLSLAEYSMKGEIAIKVAVLAEKFATEAPWYITTTLKLIALAGNHITDEVWERTVQIVVNNEKIQPLAVKTVIRQLKAHSFPESIVKVSAFVVGEFGYLVESTIPVEQQFNLLIDKYHYCSSLTRGMLLSCFLKMYVRFDSVRPQILDIFETETVSTDAEVQQRAVEYLKLLTRDDSLSMAKEVLAPLPPFLNNNSPLIARLGNVKDAKESTSVSALAKRYTKAAPPPPAPRRARAMTNNSSIKSLTPQQTSDSSSRLSANLAQLSSDNLTSSSISNGHAPTKPVSQTEELTAEEDPKRLISQLSPNWEEGYYRLIHFDQGIFYESSMLKIIYRCKKGKNNLNFQLTYVNKSPLSITGFTASIKSASTADSPFVINVSEIPETYIPLNGRSTHVFECITRDIFDNSKVPVLSISFMSGTFTQLSLRLPILLIKSLSPAPITSGAEFFRRWQQISLLGSEGESQRIFTVGHRHNNVSLERVIGRIGFGIVPNVDVNSNNIVGAGILHTLKGSSGCLLRLEPDDEGKQFRITMRCTSPGSAKILTDTIIELFEHGF